MTVVAWDGVTLSADRKCACGNASYPIKKVFSINGSLVGLTGNTENYGPFKAWVEGGCNPDKYPTLSNFMALVIRPEEYSPRIEIYETKGYPMGICESFHAIGSGRAYALAAMHLGKTSKEAVKVASRFDPSCGLGVDSLSFTKRRKTNETIRT